MKPGYKTSEFWLTLVVTLLGTLLASGVLSDGSQIAVIIGGAMTLLKALGYTYSRQQVKRGESMAAAVATSAVGSEKSSSANPTED